MRHARWTGTRTLLRVRGRLVIMAVAFALPLIASSPAAAAKHVPQSFVGVVADGPLLNDPKVDYDKQLDTMVGGGVQTLRTSFNWSGVQPYRNFDAVPAGEERPLRHQHRGPPDVSGPPP